MLTGTAGSLSMSKVKPAEDGSADTIVRLYESKRMAARACLAIGLPFSSAAETDMLENVLAELTVLPGGTLDLDFRPFEIKTIRIKP